MKTISFNKKHAFTLSALLAASFIQSEEIKPNDQNNSSTQRGATGNTSQDTLADVATLELQIENEISSIETTLNGGTAGQVLTSTGGGNPPIYTTPFPATIPVTVPDGGTGRATLTAHGVLVGEGTSAVTSVTSGTAGAVLLGTASDPAFVVPTAGTGLTLTSNATTLQYALTTPVSVANGGTGDTTLTQYGVLVGEGTSAVNATAAGTNGQVLIAGTAANPAFVTPTAGTGLTLTSNATTLQYALTAPVSVANGGTGDTTLTQYAVLLGEGTSAVAFASPGATGIPLVSTGATSNPSFGTAVVAGGGTGLATLTTYELLAGGITATGNLQQIGIGSSGQALISAGAGALPAFGTLSVAGGGTGDTTLTAHGVLLGEGTSSVAFAVPTTTGYPLVSNGASSDPSFQILPVTGGGTGATSFTTDGMVYSNGTTLVSTAAGGANTVLLGTGGAPSFGLVSNAALVSDVINLATGTNISISNTSPTLGGAATTIGLTGTVAIGNGGTGATTFTTDGIIYSNGTTLVSTAAGGANTVLLGNGGVPSFGAVPNAALANDDINLTAGTNISISNTSPVLGGSATTIGLTGTVAVANGGTGATTLTGILIGNGASAVTANTVTQYDVLVGGATNGISSVAPSATSGIPLISNGSTSNPSFGTAVVAGGGTGVTTLTAYAPIVGGTSSTGVLQQATTGFSTSGHVLTSTGASSLPTWQVAIQTIDGDDATSVTGSTITITGGSQTYPDGSGAVFIGSGTTLSESFNYLSLPATAATVGQILISGAPVLHSYGGSSNIFVGADAGNLSTVTGTNNSALGSGALTLLTSGNNNNAIGYQAIYGFGTVTGNDNNAVGYGALSDLSSGSNNNAIGSHALSVLTSGTDNNAVGYNALYYNTSGSFNNAAGSKALYGNSSGFSGSNNNVFGNEALYSGITATLNSAFGDEALYNLTTGNYNSALGASSLIGSTTGSYNIGVGYSTGTGYTGSESSNILLNAEGSLGENNTLHIGNGTGIGHQELNAAYISGIYGISLTGGTYQSVSITPSGQLGLNPSSRRYKENIEDMDEASSKVLDLRPVTFTYKSDADHNSQRGLIAEEVEEIMPELVIYNKDGGAESVKYQDLPVLLLNELQKSIKHSTVLENQIQDLKNENSALSATLIALINSSIRMSLQSSSIVFLTADSSNAQPGMLEINFSTLPIIADDSTSPSLSIVRRIPVQVASATFYTTVTVQAYRFTSNSDCVYFVVTPANDALEISSVGIVSASASSFAMSFGSACYGANYGDGIIYIPFNISIAEALQS